MLNSQDLDLLANTPPERLAYVKSVAMVFDAVLVRKWRYATGAISTGKRMYDAFLEYGVRSIAELNAKDPAAYREKILLPNIEESIWFANDIHQRTGDPVISPAKFEAQYAVPGQKWTQPEYMFVWYMVLGPKTFAHDLPENWAFTTGGLKEATRSIEIRHGRYDGPLPENVDAYLGEWLRRADLHDRRICDSRGNSLEFHELLLQAKESILWIYDHGFDVTEHTALMNSWRSIFLEAVADPLLPEQDNVWHNGKRINFIESRLAFDALARKGLLEPVPRERRIASSTQEWYVACGGSPMLAADYARNHEAKLH